jgi:hypothetical protein
VTNGNASYRPWIRWVILVDSFGAVKTKLAIVKQYIENQKHV